MNYQGTVTRAVTDEGIYVTIEDLGGNDNEFGPCMMTTATAPSAGDIVLLVEIGYTQDNFVVTGVLGLP